MNLSKYNQSERVKPMKPQAYFQTTITSGSIEERDIRIAHQSEIERGFWAIKNASTRMPFSVI